MSNLVQQRMLGMPEAPPKETPIARNSDPETSKVAAADFGRVTAKEAFLIGLRRGKPAGSTAMEAATQGHDRGGPSIESIRKRCKELVEAGLIEESGKRKCVMTQKMATTYKEVEA